MTARSPLAVFYCLLLTACCSLLFPHAARAQKASRADNRPAADAAGTRDDARLLEVGRAEKLNQAAAPVPLPAEVKIVSYNMRWRGGEDLRKLIEVLRSDAEIGGAFVIALQEADRHRARSGNVNTAKLIADELGMHYAWAAPPHPEGAEAEEDETGVALLSPYPLTDVERIVLPHAGPGGRRRVALGATVQYERARRAPLLLLRVYTVHAETRLALARKTEQWRAVLDALDARHPKEARAVVLGDFNSIKDKDVRAVRGLFDEARFSTPFPDDKSTWKTLFVKLKLDWLWLRGLDATSHGIARHVKFSDHWPLWVKVKL